ncbi:hypothetical protein [Phenylobacterium sp.]|uniref:hypothetical protein n=1 Tax=Phenylobacterium sp. TaxID=1871053 RepID=UPI00273705FA|nr:hypothetical protein [Phenylobacterium sp.]MDP3659870.1 hypothetical protein [Phenylobacterium sp.]
MLSRRTDHELVGEAFGAGPEAEDVRAAYERGRRDERAERRRHPVMMTVTIIAALVGAGVLFVAAKEGSFARGGVVVDQNLSDAADRAEPVVRDAAGDAGRALKGAGETVREKAADAVK